MLLVILIDDRVKWPSERSEWLLDAAAARHHGNKPPRFVAVLLNNLLSSGKRSNGSLVVRDCQETAIRLLTTPAGV